MPDNWGMVTVATDAAGLPLSPGPAGGAPEAWALEDD